MSQTTKVSLRLEFSQLLDVIHQLSVADKRKLLAFLIKHTSEKEDMTLTHIATEAVLAKDWLTQMEDEAWQNL